MACTSVYPVSSNFTQTERVNLLLIHFPWNTHQPVVFFFILIPLYTVRITNIVLGKKTHECVWLEFIVVKLVWFSDSNKLLKPNIKISWCLSKGTWSGSTSDRRAHQPYAVVYMVYNTQILSIKLHQTHTHPQWLILIFI